MRYRSPPRADVVRVSLGGLEQAEFAGAGDRGVAVLDAELAVQGALVGFDGVERDVEPLADLTARQPGHQQPKDLAAPWR